MIKKNLRDIIFVLSAASLVMSCGGGGGGGSAPPVSVPPTGGITPPPPTGTCSLQSRQEWAKAQIDEWYLFPETLPATLDTAGFTSVQAYIDGLTATARAQGRDKFFTFVTSIQQENAFTNSGASAGFGIRIAYDNTAGTAIVSEAFEGAPGLFAGIDRGTEILAIGTSDSNLVTVSSLMASGGPAAVSNALGPSTAGTTRVLRIRNALGTSVVTVVKADFNLQPVSSRYGARIINDGDKKIGYLNMRNFILSADDQLRVAFADFRAQGITDLIVDFRYNTGGVILTAELMSNLIGGQRSSGDVMSRTTFRASKSSRDRTTFFSPQSQSVRPMKIAFITTRSTASASEIVMNNFASYFGTNAALIGSDTSGKPVGQVGLDQAACDDRLRVVALSTQNNANEGFYYNGMARVMRSSCQASDDLTRQLGDPQEASIARAIDFIQGRSCTPITPNIAAVSAKTGSQPFATGPEFYLPEEPTVAQREVPGLM
jgi:carboxyl-terminal processing protease